MEPMIEDRLVDIEMKLTDQEDTVQELNKLVFQQQKRIEQLERLCEALLDQVRGLSESAPQRSLRDELPPHY
jgi:SlyX protein